MITNPWTTNDATYIKSCRELPPSHISLTQTKDDTRSSQPTIGSRHIPTHLNLSQLTIQAERNRNVLSSTPRTWGTNPPCIVDGATAILPPCFHDTTFMRIDRNLSLVGAYAATFPRIYGHLHLGSPLLTCAGPSFAEDPAEKMDDLNSCFLNYSSAEYTILAQTHHQSFRNQKHGSPYELQ